MPRVTEGGIHYDDEAIEALLDRSQSGIEHKEELANEYLSSFKVATFSTVSEEPSQTPALSSPAAAQPREHDARGAAFWEFLRADYEAAQVANAPSAPLSERCSKE